MGKTKSKIGKYLDWTRGEDEALLNILGGPEVARKLLRGDLKFSISDEAVEIVPAIQKLFDKNGRRIKPKELKSAVCDPDKDYFVHQPSVSYKDRLCKGFTNTGLNAFMSLADFSDKAEKLLNQLRSSEQLKNLLKGPYLPIIIPKTHLTDLGAMTEDLVKAAGKSYQNHFTKLFGKRSFTNHRKSELEGQVTVVNGSRYERVVENIQKESMVGIYFPTVLQGFSVHADIKQMVSLPESLILSGPLDITMAFAMYPDVLGRYGYTPVYDCSAVNWRSSGYSLYFRSDEGVAYFDGRVYLSLARGCYSGGMLFVG